MGLTSSLIIGRSALAASELAIQVTGNNIANAATPGYHRQRAELSPLRGQREGLSFAGRGVQVQEITRAIDPSLVARLRRSIGQEQASMVERNVLDSLEALTNELTGSDLSSQLSRYFNAWSEMANNPSSSVTRAAVVEEGASLASFIRGMRRDVLEQRNSIDRQLEFNVERTNTLLDEIAQLNRAIVNSEQGAGQDGNLRDQRGVLLDELAGLMDITTIETESGAVNVLVDSLPVVLGTDSRGLQLDIRSIQEDPANGIEGGLEVRVMSVRDEEEVRVSSGTIGGLLEQREAAVQRTLDELDGLASALIFEVNNLHTTGRPAAGLTDVTGSLVIDAAHQTLALNDPTNNSIATLPFGPSNGSFNVRITDQNGNTFDTTIEVDLDGVTNSGAAGFGDDTSLADLAAALDAIPNLNAQITPAGELRVFTDNGFDVSFGDDTSGVLATLGVGTFFTGEDGRDIAVRADLRSDPELLSVGTEPGRNETALAIAQLSETAVDSAGGRTLQDLWLRSVERNAVNARAAQTKLDSLSTVRASLESQERAIGGVSMDEESINLIAYQQQYQGAARYISVVDELTNVLLSLV